MGLMTVWNGASWYFEVFSRKYQAALEARGKAA
jgi:hypothetical protein